MRIFFYCAVALCYIYRAMPSREQNWFFVYGIIFITIFLAVSAIALKAKDMILKREYSRKELRKRQQAIIEAWYAKQG